MSSYKNEKSFNVDIEKSVDPLDNAEVKILKKKIHSVVGGRGDRLSANDITNYAIITLSSSFLLFILISFVASYSQIHCDSTDVDSVSLLINTKNAINENVDNELLFKNSNDIDNLKSLNSFNSKSLSQYYSKFKLPGDGSQSLEAFEPSREFKQIVSISPITIFLLNENYDLKNFKFKKILTQFIEIIPQPTIVSLMKHPNSAELIQYINTVSMEQSYSFGEAATVDGNPNDPELDVTDESIKATTIKKDSFLPGLFLKGRLIANFDKIEQLFNSNELSTYLKKLGDGKIKVEQIYNSKNYPNFY